MKCKKCGTEMQESFVENRVKIDTFINPNEPIKKEEIPFCKHYHCKNCNYKDKEKIVNK